MNDPLILIFPGVLLFAIVGVGIAIYSLKGSKDQEIQGNKDKENKQNRLYETGKELEGITALLNAGRNYDACKSFEGVSAKIDQFKHTDFATIDWKTYFEQVKASRDQTKEYLTINCPQELKKLFYENQVILNKAKEEEKRAKKSQLITTIIILIIAAIVIGGMIFVAVNAINESKKRGTPGFIMYDGKREYVQ